jgi:hypothetical protein
MMLPGAGGCRKSLHVPLRALLDVLGSYTCPTASTQAQKPEIDEDFRGRTSGILYALWKYIMNLRKICARSLLGITALAAVPLVQGCYETTYVPPPRVAYSPPVVVNRYVPPPVVVNRPVYVTPPPRIVVIGDYDDYRVWHDRNWWLANHPRWVQTHHPDWLARR